MIEEEVYSDSDNSSVYTSEDDFEEDKGIVNQCIHMSRDYDVRMAEEAAHRQYLRENPI